MTVLPPLWQVSCKTSIPTDTQRTRGWIAEATLDGEVRRVGSIFVMRDSDDWARLRLFLVTPESRGTGLAQRMIETAIVFARQVGYGNMR